MEKRTVLVYGAAGMDMISVVAEYPPADAKIRALEWKVLFGI
jgi:hypothetical protein